MDDETAMDPVARLRGLEAENASLAARLRHAELSAQSQAMRAQAWHWAAGVSQAEVAIIRRSLFWRLTLPARLAVVVARGLPNSSAEGKRIRQALALVRKAGVREALRQARAWQRQQRRSAPMPGPTPAPTSKPGPTPTPGPTADQGAAAAPAAASGSPISLSPLVLIVAELSVPQCAKYRVWQKQEHFERLGVPCRVVDWHDTNACLSAAALASQAILYRVPAVPGVLALIDTLRGYGVPFAWEVDDLIFDEALYRQNSNLADLEPELREEVLQGVTLYRQALLACGRGIASTPELAQAMRDAGVADVAVVENALDDETLDLAARIIAARAPHDGVLITYGSGTKTHDTDFLQAAPALLRLLQSRPEARLRIIGELALPAGFGAFAARIERVPPVPYGRYLALLGDSDISIAPLEPSVFNDAKSNIKFLEAAILQVPSVCSARAQFVSAMRNGENGFLADGEQSWFAALDALAGSAALRARLGGAARADVLARYAPGAVARRQVAPLIVPVTAARKPGALRVMMANVFYAPRSFGGATIVVEELAKRLNLRADTEIAIVTTLGDVPHQAVTRRVQEGITVFGVPTTHGDVISEYDDPQVAEIFGQVLQAVRPDVVHLHSVQQLSASLATACRARGIPYLITLHDPWWLCGRQFMVKADGQYCFQRRIDLRICEACMPGARHLRPRAALLRDALDGAALLVSPSAAHRDLYLAQGIAPDRIVVAPNGVRLPAALPPRKPAARLRFGYVGGNEKVKGYGLVRKAFAGLARADWDLVLVDNTLNLGFSSIDAADWSGARGTVRILPAYSQDTMDAFFAGIDVLLFPSQWKESFGLTVREALARGVWVITTDGGGPADAVEDGVNGTIIPLDGHHDGLQRAVQALLDKPESLAGDRATPGRTIIGYEAQAMHLREILGRVGAA